MSKLIAERCNKRYFIILSGAQTNILLPGLSDKSVNAAAIGVELHLYVINSLSLSIELFSLDIVTLLQVWPPAPSV